MQVKPKRGVGWRREQKAEADVDHDLDNGDDDGDDDPGSGSMADAMHRGNGRMALEHPSGALPALLGGGIAEEAQWQKLVAVLEERGLGSAFQWLSSLGISGL